MVELETCALATAPGARSPNEHTSRWAGAAPVTEHVPGPVAGRYQVLNVGGARVRLLQNLFGRENVYVELMDHGNPLDSDHNDALGRPALLDALAGFAREAVARRGPGRR